MREALFARVGSLAEVAVLDLFAGTGALGIEALSRGAERAIFVERSAAVVAVLRANLAALGLEAASQVVRADAATAVRRLARRGERFDLVFLDPPYASPEAGRTLRALASSGILRQGSRVVLETSRHAELEEVPGLVRLDERGYGDTRVIRFAPAGSDSEEGGSSQP